MTAERYNRPALTWRCMICKWWCQLQMKIYWKPDVKENWQCGLFPSPPLFLRDICKWTWTSANCDAYCVLCIFGDISTNKYFCKLLLDITYVLSHYWSYCYFSHIGKLRWLLSRWVIIRGDYIVSTFSYCIITLSVLLNYHVLYLSKLITWLVLPLMIF